MTDALETVRILCSYRHDALDRLAVVDPGAQDSVLRFYQKSRLTVEIQGAVRRRIFQSGDHLLAEHSTEGSAARVDMLGTDAQRSVLHAVAAHERQSLVYSPYGHRLQGAKVSGFNGERADPVTGHYLLGNGYRAFNPVLMRFNQPDTLSPFGLGGLNAYAYCLGDPVNVRDPSGHIPVAAALSTLSPFERLPAAVLEQVFKKLPGKDLISLSRTSKWMSGSVSGITEVPKINISDSTTLQKIHGELKGEALGVLPAKLKSDPVYKVQFGYAAKAGDKRMVAQFEDALEQRQSLVDRVTGRKGASYFEFEAQLARDRRIYADNPANLQRIDKVARDYRALDAHATSLIHQRADQGRLADEIRRNLNS
ncbi:RHS repeat-associated core domain-containing protein [Pseudomonas viridiflava]|uniref:RHS repeat-associated core domain-containing protein n=3 Tax=Pseudomonas viridiflava TaxID=33069 RepID=A0ABU7N1M1_PSEVI|nr:RHS repeat-associated core domain-containing protein [Pseudomonas viridiflava]MEE4038822.1 RHS repeat-associated core domain-containing protein [Pseudomonas viridiflava]MEE4058804.1 RHS repeat-associated core domain-containing protein [Pseudomonas viridiflava]MEE4167277.1 RHS repeat-associated core domain-containing protein [Pseudomonas viridiflava]